jgi:hypothetical protein
MREQPLRLPVGASDAVEGLDEIACVTEDPSLVGTMAMYGGVDAGRTERIEWLIDASGLLRST